MNEKASILFTGGGSSGHVTPNLALIETLSKEGYKLLYMGSSSGIEKELVERAGIRFYGIQSGKLRRYFSFENLIDVFKVLIGAIQSIVKLYQLKPDVVFSKGGYVTFPVVFGAWVNRIPVIVHESDATPGLSNKLSFPFANKICITFSNEGPYKKYKDKLIVSGAPIRDTLLEGSKERGLTITGFKNQLPTIFIYGGGQGALNINRVIRDSIEDLTKHYNIIHICGYGKSDAAFENIDRYRQYEYVHEELKDFLSMADLIISRAGATAIFEILSLCKPHILIPLSKEASRGEQIANAAFLAQSGATRVLDDASLSSTILIGEIESIFSDLDVIKKALKAIEVPDSKAIISGTIKELISQRG